MPKVQIWLYTNPHLASKRPPLPAREKVFFALFLLMMKMLLTKHSRFDATSAPYRKYKEKKLFLFWLLAAASRVTIMYHAPSSS